MHGQQNIKISDHRRPYSVSLTLQALFQKLSQLTDSSGTICIDI